MNVGLPHFLTVGAILFALGLFAVMSRRNAIGILMGVELMLNASNINFVAFSRYVEHAVDGQIMAAFVIVLAAAEAAVALAIVLAMYRNFGTANADVVQSLKR
ncbi:NADH-quinone oxidoreductase subunit NuoK [bacterium]|nr:NADH-quinone oxidoreductase subunit NuoK [bacterium]PIV80393.1 MAG: NADH-quinone oxidoreductase subunit NuoK [bacterium CG17_big_fil_post_rev_8_21_14_2_50_64_8]PJA77085.1 MAG: NADH-quinone oxidoreductase subunit NuoK [bacterium CG_4_9_14_3_um_filter_65_15]